jgi:transcriptional regulator with XRE-family HTH domain
MTIRDPEWEFRKRLRWAVERIGGLSELARRLETSPGTVHPWLQKGGSMPNGAFMLRLPAALEVDGDWLLTGEGSALGKRRGGFAAGVAYARTELERTLSKLG